MKHLTRWPNLSIPPSATARLAILVLMAVGTAQAGDGSFVGKSRATCVPPRTTPVSVAGKDPEDKIRESLQALNRLRSKVEEWGTATISAPVAVFVPGAFDLPDQILTPEKILEQVQKERVATAFQATDIGISNQLGVTATPTLIPGMTAAPASPAGSTTTTTTTSQTVVPPLFNSSGQIRPSLNAESIELPAAASTSQFGNLTAPFSLVPNLAAPNGSVSDAFKRTDNIIVQQKIFSQMSKPKPVEGLVRVIFCVVQVSCNPGWRTNEHYIADCSASLEYYDFCNRKELNRSFQREPTVFSVLPLIDAQTVEMGNSQREVTQLATQLAASLPAKGVDFKAKDLFQFVKRYSRDLRSVAPIPVVNSYSSGGTFGFRFSPSFQALRDPAQRQARAANVLLPTSFPALITVLIHDKDLKLAASDFGKSNEIDLEHGVLPEGFGIRTHIANRWYLKDRPPLYQFYKRLYTPMRRDSSGLEMWAANDSAVIYDARHLLEDEYQKDYGPKSTLYIPALEDMRRQLIDLESKGVGRSWPIDIGGDALARMAVAAKASAGEKSLQEKLDEAKAELKDAKDALKKAQDTNDGFLKQENDRLWQFLNNGKTGTTTTGAAAAKTAAEEVEEIDGVPVRRAVPAAVPRTANTANLDTPLSAMPFPLEMPTLMLDTPAVK